MAVLRASLSILLVAWAQPLIAQNSDLLDAFFSDPPAQEAPVTATEPSPADSPAPSQPPVERPAEPATSESTSPTPAPVPASDQKKEPSEGKSPRTKIHWIALSGSYEDYPSGVSFDPTALILGGGPGKTKSFYKLCENLESYANETSDSWILFDLSDSSTSMNPAQLEELARRMELVRKAGKKTVAWLESANSIALSIASQCDRVVLADLGSIDFPSASMETIFYKEAMDLFGVKASVVRAGDFKGAVEPYMNPKMSEHLREHYVAMLQSINDALVDRIAKGRALPPAKVRELQKQRMFLPEEALAAKLVDQLAPYGSMKSTMEQLVGKPVEWVDPQKKPKKDVSLFELMGKMMAGPKDIGGKTKPSTIAVLHLSGAIEDGKKPSGGSIVSGPTVEQIRKLIDDKNVIGVVVRINSPGGSATASEAIRQELKKLADTKPTVISMGEVAASGGYWISCIGAPILAEPGTITGSIGVFTLKLSAGSLMRRVGVHLESITLDSAAGLDALDRAWDDQDEQLMQKSIDQIYDRFLKLVSQSRSLPLEQVKPLAGGRVWSGTQAKQAGLVDQLGGLDQALAMVAKKAGVDKYEQIQRPEASGGIDLLELLGESDEESLRVITQSPQWRWMSERGMPAGILSDCLEQSISGRSGPPKIWAMHPAVLRVR
jgi:protease-4